MNSHLTAIYRKTLPLPIRWLLENNYLYGNILDYGCGKCGDVNEKYLQTHEIKSIHNYDPYFSPHAIVRNCENGYYDIVLCTYVLCTLKKKSEKRILTDIQSLLKKDGIAFITVRNDVPKQGYGLSKRNTYQRKVILPLEEMKKTTSYRIYILHSNSKIA